MGISRRLAAVSILAIAASLAAPLAGAQSDSGLGTWKLNEGKSKFAPGGFSPILILVSLRK